MDFRSGFPVPGSRCSPAQEFDARGATPAANAFAKRISAKMTDVAGRVEAIGDLQNVTDLFLLANLLEREKLAEKAGLDLGWLLAAGGADGAGGAGAYHVQSLTEPRTAQTIVSDNGSVITEGGVLINGELLAVRARGSCGDGFAGPAGAPGRRMVCIAAAGKALRRKRDTLMQRCSFRG